MDTDKEETNETQEDRIEFLKKKGDRHFTVEGRTAEIKVDLVLQARAKMSDNKEIRSYRAIALTSVMSKWCASCIIFRLEKEREPENWKNLHVGGVGWDKLPTLASDEDECTTETLGMGGRKTNNVFGKLGHQDGFR